MKEEPVISAGAIKAALLLVLFAAIGFGTYALAGGDVDLPDLPELPEIETTTDGEESGQTEPAPTASPVEPFSASGMRAALAAVRGEVGPRADLTRVSINPVQTVFHVRRSDSEAEGLGFNAASRELAEISVLVSGSDPLSEIDFPLAAVRPGVVERLAAGARALLRAPAAEFDVFDLSRSPIDGRLEWTLTVTARGRSFALRAGPGGGGVEDLSGGGIELPAAVIEARERARCIEEAAGDSEAIFACLE